MSLLDYSNLTEDYEKSLRAYGASPKALLWWDYRSMAIRFRELVKSVPVEGRTILDAGCGMGDLLPYLYCRSTNFNYIGVDKNKEFIKIAQSRYEGHNFKVADPFNTKIGTFDVIFSSGVMNGNTDNWLEKRKKMIANLYDQANQVLAFNMAGGLKPAPSDSLIAYADATEIYDYCKTLAGRVTLNTEYLNMDFTIVMIKDN